MRSNISGQGCTQDMFVRGRRATVIYIFFFLILKLQEKTMYFGTKGRREGFRG